MRFHLPLRDAALRFEEWCSTAMVMISYAQALEDVLLHRALQHVHHDRGFYIDIGGFDPDHDSVTRHFYDHGWRGINVEPGQHLFPRFVDRRPRDINLQVAVTDESGEATFYEVVGNEQLCTLEQRFATMHEQAGYETRAYTVPAMTLTEICDIYVERNIHFLKVDVEGHEHAVLKGMDFNRYRPWILVIESTVPNNNHISIYGEWHDLVSTAGYKLAYTDVLNRYYVAEEHPTLLPHFAVPADHYILAKAVREHEAERSGLQERLRHAERTIREMEDAAIAQARPRKKGWRLFGT